MLSAYWLLSEQTFAEINWGEGSLCWEESTIKKKNQYGSIIYEDEFTNTYIVVVQHILDISLKIPVNITVFLPI